MLDQRALGSWLERLRTRDPELYEALSQRVGERLMQVESVAAGIGPAPSSAEILAETIVREGRPALFVADGRITDRGGEIDAGGKIIFERLKRAAPKLEPMIPLVGRVDVVNFPGSATYLGTAWLIDEDVVVTNRHVAELVARWDGSSYQFVPGRFNRTLDVKVDYKHEAENAKRSSVKVERVLWIEPDPAKADIAFLQVKRRADGTGPKAIPLAKADAPPDTDVAVVGYPARAPAEVIPDQARMDRIYGGAYDVKRIAPGKMDRPSRGWATHDCTTLGGNSGSCALSMATGEAVALHFAGLYMVENYAVPASTLRRYIAERPWQGPSRRPVEATTGGFGGGAVVRLSAGEGSGSSPVTIPLTITISLGPPQAAGSAAATGERPDVVGASHEFERQIAGTGVVRVGPGYVVSGGEITDRECIAIAVDPEHQEEVQGRCPATFSGFPVVVRPATLVDIVGGAAGFQTEAPLSIGYNDDDRTGPDFSLDAFAGKMSVTCHVGPEQGWLVWKEFVKDAKTLVSSMYQFFAGHTAQSIEEAVRAGASLELTLADETHDPHGKPTKTGEFNRADTFARWDTAFKKRFKRVYVPFGNGKLIAKSYHIKVTVRDGHLVWLSSGNWTLSSQPKVEPADLANPKEVSRRGNREWNVVVDSKELAKRLSHHIQADFRRSLDLGGTPEAVAVEEPLVDVPRAALESVVLEAAADRVLDPLDIGPRKIKVQPLLTPDRQGKVYTDAVVELIGSAKRQLVFQNQYILASPKTTGNLAALVDALARKAGEIDDVRLILRGSSGELLVTGQELKRRGFPDVNNRLRGLPNTHTKGIVVDGKRVLVGSQNWSGLGVSLNRDASLLFDDEEIARYFLEAFEIDWNRATTIRDTVASTALAAPRLATRETPPPGYERMTLSEYLEG